MPSSTRPSVLLYDENGNPRQVRDRKGQVTQTTFDPLNRPKVVTWADASTTTLTWDASNRLTQLVDTIWAPHPPAGTSSIGYSTNRPRRAGSTTLTTMPVGARP